MIGRRFEWILRIRSRALALLASWLLAITALGESPAKRPFSDDERRRLAKGELITRPVAEKRDGLRLIGGSSWQVVDATPEALYRALLETRFYPRMLPGVSAAKLVSADDRQRRVRIEHEKGPLGTAYRMALKLDPVRRDITFKLNDRLDSGLRAAWGFLTVHPYGASQSLIAYGVMADPGDGLLVSMVRGIIHEWLLKLPQQVKRFVEGPTGRALYGSGALRAVGQLDGGQPQQRAP